MVSPNTFKKLARPPHLLIPALWNKGIGPFCVEVRCIWRLQAQAPHVQGALDTLSHAVQCFEECPVILDALGYEHAAPAESAREIIAGS
jgi:hypothetical protein